MQYSFLLKPHRGLQGGVKSANISATAAVVFPGNRGRMAYIIATANMKGGVGKTTLTVNLAASLAKHFQKRVLVVDLDTQISATLSLMSPQDFAKRRKEQRTLKHVVNQIVRRGEATQPTVLDVVHHYIGSLKGFDLLPGDIDLYDEFLVSETLFAKASQDPNHNFAQAWNRLERILLQRILEPLHKDYDFIVLDCAPGYSLLTRSALVSSDFYILPAKPEPLSVVGIQLLERRIEELRQNHQLTDEVTTQLLGIVFTMTGGIFTSRYYRQVMQRVHTDFSAAKVFQTQVPQDVSVSKAVDTFTPIVLSNPTATGAKVFVKLTQEFLKKLEVSLGEKEQKTKLNLAAIE